MELPDSYVLSKFYALAGNPESSRNFYRASCPICKEGASWLKKKRLYYFPDDGYMYCHHCSASWTPYFWIKEVTGMSFIEIIKEVKDYTGEDFDFQLVQNTTKSEEQIFNVPSMPNNCVDLSNPLQLDYYKDNRMVNIALDYCKSRRLFSAINAPKTFFVCLEDYFHKNRLIIPLYDSSGRIISYASRKLLESDTKAKYLIKINSDKPIFNFNKIDGNFPYLFIFEGQVDSMFIKNGIAISGIHMTDKQEKEINNLYPFHAKIWCLDNFRFEDSKVVEKIKEKVKNGERVFLYDGEFSEYKDLNEFCMKKNLDFINPDLILNSSYSGNRALLKLCN